MTAKGLENLEAQMAGLLRSLVDIHGFEFPIRCAIVGANGYAALFEYDLPGDLAEGETGHPTCKILATHDADGVARLPINMMWVSDSGEAASVVISREGVEPEIIH